MEKTGEKYPQEVYDSFNEKLEIIKKIKESKQLIFK